MASQVPYNDGVATVSPASTPPDDYEHINASPDAFGASIGKGLEQLGAGAKTAVDYYTHATVDDASNQFQASATKLMHGDPNATVKGPDGMPVMGPDGKPMPDTGYLGTEGRTAMDQRQSVDAALDKRQKELSENLSPEAQQQFNSFAQKYRTQQAERVASHADQQSKTWYSSVNTSSAKLSMEHIANNFDNPKEVAAGAADLTNAYVKNAQLQSGSLDGPQVQEALVAARRDALDSQLNAMAVKDPSRALAVLDKNKEIAGTKYDEMAAKFRGRAKQQQGYDIADQVLKQGYQGSGQSGGYSPAVYTQAGAAYGVSGSYLQRTHQLENPNNTPGENSAGADGPFQFTRKTAGQYGLLLNERNNFEKSADAAARLAADNRSSLNNSLGRPPTDAELYLAHQQGAGGAATLLRNPNVRAGSLVGDAAIRQNGGDPNAPALQFTSMWAAKYAGAPSSGFVNQKAQAFQTIASMTDIDPDVRAHAEQHVTQELQAAQIAQEQDAKAQKAKSDQMQTDLVRQIISGTGPDIIGKIANSGLPANEMENLYKFATNEGGIQDDQRYGPGYTAAFKQVLSNPDDPSHISTAADVIARGAPGGDLTKKGVTEILGVMEKIKKQPDQAGIATVKSHQLDYYLDKFAIDQNSPLAGIPGVKPQRDQKGTDRFNHDFVPAFEAAYSQWVGASKDPMEFLTDNKKMDDIMNRVYPPSERAADAIKAQPGAEKPPPAPEGASQGSWDSLMSSPPKLRTGDNIPLAKWGSILTWLAKDPSPENKAAFDAKMGPSGYTADMVLKRLPHAAAPAASGAAPTSAPAAEPLAAEPAASPAWTAPHD